MTAPPPPATGSPGPAGAPAPHVLYEKRGHLALILFNRPEKRNAFTLEMFRLLGSAFAEAERDPEIRCAVVAGEGPDLTTGLDLASVAPAWMSGERPFLDGMVDPWGTSGASARTKPLVVAAQGRSYTLGVELALASDACVAASDVRFALLEATIGIYPAGGGTFRFVRAAGWSNAMRYALTGDEFGASEALRMGVVQEVVEPGAQLDRALEIAERIAANPPLAVAGALESARTALDRGDAAAVERIPDDIVRLLRTRDAAEALAARMERRAPLFEGR